MHEESSESQDIVLFLRFDGQRTLPNDVVDTLGAIKDLLKEDEVQEIGELCDTLQISPMIRDAVLYSLGQDDVERFFIEVAKPGSLELLAVVAAATYFVLQKTLGESVKDGYLSSDLHVLVKDWIAKRINEKMTRLARDLPDHWRVRRLSPAVSVDWEKRLITV